VSDNATTTSEQSTPFEDFGKIARLNRECTITEKIDARSYSRDANGQAAGSRTFSVIGAQNEHAARLLEMAEMRRETVQHQSERSVRSENEGMSLIAKLEASIAANAAIEVTALRAGAAARKVPASRRG
jgi:hypothetical protein